MPSLKSIRLRKNLKASRFLSAFVVRTVLTMALLAAAAAAEANEAAKSEAAKDAPESEHRLIQKEKRTCRWSEHESRMTSYMARIRTLEKEISDLIEQKRRTENGEKANLLTRQITFKHADLAKVVGEYEQERRHARFQHPDRDLDGNREYSAHPLKSLEDIEVSFGLDGRVARIRRQIAIVFPVAPSKDAAKARAPASAVTSPDDDDEMPRGIKLVK